MTSMATEAAFPAPRPIDRRLSIAILAHADLGLPGGMTIARLAEEHWTPAGHRVVAHRGDGAPPPADLAILHVGLTKIDTQYLELAARYPRVINGRLKDTFKRSICNDLVHVTDGYEGPIIVKTNLNYGGYPEWKLRRQRAGRFERAWLGLERRLPPRWFGRLRTGKYPVFARKAEVPGWMWRSPHLVVQPLHTERHGQFYLLHQWYFLGDRDCVTTFVGREPVVKRANLVDRLPLHGDVPEALRRRRVELKFDYGKFDYVMVDGEPKLLDANSTPSGMLVPATPREFALCAAIASGLDAFLE